MQLTQAAERGCPAIQVEMTVDHAKSRDRCDPLPALLGDRFQSPTSRRPSETLFVTSSEVSASPHCQANETGKRNKDE